MSVPEQKPGRSKQNYATPEVFIRPVKRKLGIDEFVIDLAADDTNTKAPRWIDEARDSLTVDWAKEIVSGWAWLNPPYADIEPWALKCHETVDRHGPGIGIAFLVPAAVGANWYRDYVHNKHCHVLFLNGRIPFIPDKPKWLYPKDCILGLYQYGNAGNAIWSWRDRSSSRPPHTGRAA